MADDESAAPPPQEEPPQPMVDDPPPDDQDLRPSPSVDSTATEQASNVDETSSSAHTNNSKPAAIFNRLNRWRKSVDQQATTLWRKPSSLRSTESAPTVLQSAQLSPSAVGEEEEDDDANDRTRSYDDDSTFLSDSAYEDDSSYVSSSVYSSYVSGSGTGGGPRVAALQWAAASVVDSVQTGYFRGRYNNDTKLEAGTTKATAPSTPTTTARPLTTLTQTSRILSSPHARSHMQELMQRLAPEEYVMLLGKGMLGVNLKQAYLKSTGVYVDFLVAGGAADLSKIIHIGDILLAIGDESVRKGSILTIPGQIADTRRPIHLIWAYGLAKEERLVQADDVVVAMMHEARQRQLEQEREQLEKPAVVVLEEKKSADERDAANGDADKDDGSATSTDADAGDDAELESNASAPIVIEPVVSVEVPLLENVETFCNPPLPPLKVRQAYVHLSIKRNNENFAVDQLRRLAEADDNFRAALRHGFLLCAADGRRFPFLARHLGHQEELRSPNGLHEGRAPNAPINALLMLYVEMLNYADNYLVMSEERRQQIAHRIAHKFFLPTQSGNEVVPPMFDFHQLVADGSLRELEARLKANEAPRELFKDFSVAVVDQLSAEPFLAFLVSAEFARMRAYLRHTAPYVNVPLKLVFDSLAEEDPDPNAVNYFVYLLTYLLCQTDREGYGEFDDTLAPGDGTRVIDAASSVCAAVFIRRRLVPAVMAAQQAASPLPESVVETVIDLYKRLWEIYVAPNVGALPRCALSSDARGRLQALYEALEKIRSEHEGDEEAEVKRQVAEKLVDESLLKLAEDLAHELVYDYATISHPTFREHKIHEWLCTEISNGRQATDDVNAVPKLPAGCVKRLLRKATFPVGVAPHKPLHATSEELSTATESNDDTASLSQVSADCALVFGTSVGLDLAAQVPPVDNDGIRRYTCQSLRMDESADEYLTPEMVPPTLESYASVLETKKKPFAAYNDDSRLSADGWEISLVNFLVPRADTTSGGDEDSALYGVSLVFRAVSDKTLEEAAVKTELVSDGGAKNSNTTFVPPISFETSAHEEKASPKVLVPMEAPLFNQNMSERTWTERISREVREDGTRVTVGLALLSYRNVIPAMREALSRLLQSFSPGERLECNPIVNVLGNFAHQNVEPEALQSILEPYLRFAASPWLERPISAQKEEFEQLAGNQLVQSLPPIATALMFVTALLEQKIVLASSRRSLLLSASVALSKMLKPLKWCHLLVPRVPCGLAADLIQYPAPFILGVPSDDPHMMDLIRDLPKDVTLVDLDVGRVILAPEFAHKSEMGRGTPNNADTARVLRTQVLFLAQALGGVFGNVMDPVTWACDRVSIAEVPEASRFDRLCAVCHDFIDELSSGTASCCYWLQEAGSEANTSEQTVLFDEDRFFQIKSLRAQHGFTPLLGPAQASRLAIGLEDFDLVLEVFLRCQSMNVFIGTRDKERMAFAM